MPPKKIGVSCKPKPWLLEAIRNNDFNKWQKNGRYFILNIARASAHWNLSAEVFQNSLGVDDTDKHYCTFGTDGEVCIKAYFSKLAVEEFEKTISTQSAIRDVNSQLSSWRDCSLWLIDYCLKIMQPSNSETPECVLLVKKFAALKNSELEMEAYGAGFMNCCADFKEVKLCINDYIKDSKNAEPVNETISINSTSESKSLDTSNDDDDVCTQRALAALIVLMTDKANNNWDVKDASDDDAASVNVNISENDSESSDPPSKRRKLLSPRPAPPVVELWKTADRDLPGWLPISRELADDEVPMATSSPVVSVSKATDGTNVLPKSADANVVLPKPVASERNSGNPKMATETIQKLQSMKKSAKSPKKAKVGANVVLPNTDASEPNGELPKKPTETIEKLQSLKKSAKSPEKAKVGANVVSPKTDASEPSGENPEKPTENIEKLHSPKKSAKSPKKATVGNHSDNIEQKVLVTVRYVRTQTSNKITGWTNDQTRMENTPDAVVSALNDSSVVIETSEISEKPSTSNCSMKAADFTDKPSTSKFRSKMSEFTNIDSTDDDSTNDNLDDLISNFRLAKETRQRCINYLLKCKK